MRSLALGEVTLRLDGVPDDLRLPLPEGRNLILTATIAGGHAESVWLAQDREAKQRVALTQVGGGEFSLNLADDSVGDLLRPQDGPGQFRIFARMADGQVLESITVHYSFAYIYVDRPSVSVLQNGERYALVRPSYGSSYGSSYRSRSGKRWFRPHEVEKIEAEFRGNPRYRTAGVQVGDRSWAFGPTDKNNVLAFALGADVRGCWQREGSMTVQYGTVRPDRTHSILRAIPDRLDLPTSSVTLTIAQRAAKRVPGSQDYLWLSIGDVTGGQTLLKLTTADSRDVIGAISVSRGDELSFALGRQRYKLSVDRLVNLLFGDDYAVVRIADFPPAEQAKFASDHQAIERLLDAIEKADVVYVREGKEYTGSEAAAHLRDKRNAAGPKLMTLETFIDDVAGRSWLTGGECVVELPEGTTVKARDWLRAKAGIESNRE